MVIMVQSEVPVKIFYNGHKVHDEGFKIDLLVNDTIVELTDKDHFFPA